MKDKVNPEIRCPLCNSKKLFEVGRLKTTELETLYKRILGIYVEDEFSGHTEIRFEHCSECDLRFFSPPLAGSEKFYERLQKFDWYYLNEKDEYDYAAQYVNENDSVLEIGSGKGAFAEKIKTKKYTGLELSHNAVMSAQQNGVNVIYESLKDHTVVNAGKYDNVCAFQVLEHVSDVKGFISNAVECLRKDGLFFVAVPSADSFLASVVNGILNMPPHHMTWWSDRSLKSLSQLFGLELVGLKHEILSDIHRDWYAETVVRNALNKKLKRPFKLLDASITGNLIGKFSNFLGRFYSSGLLSCNMRPYGHTVNAIFRKP